MSAYGQAAIDAAFQLFGLDATYTPPDIPLGGSAVPIRVLPRRGDSLLDLGETQITFDSLFFEIKVADLGSPAENGLLNVNSIDYLIQAEPRLEDVEGLVWIIDARPA